MAQFFMTDRNLGCIREMREKGVSIATMATVMECSESSICRAIAVMGMPFKRTGRPLSEPWTAACDTIIRTSVADGREPGTVAKKLGRPVDAIRRRASDLGCPFPVQTLIDAPTYLHPAEARRNYEAVASKLHFEDMPVRRDPRPEFARTFDGERKAAAS